MKAGLEFSNPIPKKRKFEPGKAPELGEAEPEEGCRDKNAARSLDRFLRKNHTWKDLYWAKIPMKNPKKKANDMEEKWMPFLLPHEWLPDYFLQSSASQEGMPEEGSFCWPAGWPKLVKAMGNPLEICFLWVCMVMECLCKAE